jgi:hypothetical protein
LTTPVIAPCARAAAGKSKSTDSAAATFALRATAARADHVTTLTMILLLLVVSWHDAIVVGISTLGVA